MKLKEIRCPVIDAKAYEGKNGLHIIHSLDNTPKFGKLQHVSISKPDEYPTWDEIMEAKIHFFGDRIDAMMLMPKRENYVNIHNNCFHLWQTPESWDIM